MLKFFKKLFYKERRVTVGYGYFPYKNTWCTVKLKRSTGHFLFEWDDLFDEGRKVNFPNVPLSTNLFFKSKEATDDEFKRCLEIYKK